MDVTTDTRTANSWYSQDGIVFVVCQDPRCGECTGHTFGPLPYQCPDCGGEIAFQREEEL